MNRRPSAAVAAAILVVLAAAAVLLGMGRPPICTCGQVALWGAVGPGQSQMLADWYSASHIIHGFLFYAALSLLFRRWSVELRLVGALVIESDWEIAENTPMVIDRYRANTIALDYYGDSVLNSLADIAAMTLGFFMAARLPVWSIVLLTLAMEIGVGWWIRDNLTLNIIQLLYPLDAILRWQQGG